MAVLRITGVTTSHLELESTDGAKHTLEITEDLLKALKARKPVNPDQALTPREIQEQIRLGMTIEQLILTNPAAEDAIRKFGAPIVAELNHVVTLARNVRLNLATDRFADPSNIEFGLVMDDRLANNKATNLSWSSRKSGEGHWLVQVAFKIHDVTGSAIWSFNPKALLLTPENESAIQLSNGMTLNLSSTSSTVPSAPRQEQPNTFVHPVLETSLEQDTPTGLTLVPEIQEPVTEVIQVHEDTSSRPILRIIPEPIFETEYLDEPLDEVYEEDGFEEPVSEVNLEEVAIEEAPAAEHVEEALEKPSEPAIPQTTSRWAEVLFGAKEEDEEEF
jgi:hypothetical protein